MEWGGQKIVLIPGELFPELAFGGALEEGDAGPASMNPPTLAEILGTDDFLVVGLAADCMRRLRAADVKQRKWERALSQSAVSTKIMQIFSDP